MKIFCFASAGSSTAMFTLLKEQLPEKFQLVPIELPGHGKRYKEPLMSCIKQAVADCLGQIRNNLDQPYALLGYSMGAWIAYELYYATKKLAFPQPEHVFICSQEPPFSPHDRQAAQILHQLPEDQFREKMIELGGIPEEIQRPDVFRIFLPILKADYQIIEGYHDHIKETKMNCDITIMYSEEDKAICKSPEELLQWQQVTTGSAEFYNFKGGHFFIYSNIEGMAGVIEQRLSRFGI